MKDIKYVNVSIVTVCNKYLSIYLFIYLFIYPSIYLSCVHIYVLGTLLHAFISTSFFGLIFIVNNEDVYGIITIIDDDDYDDDDDDVDDDDDDDEEEEDDDDNDKAFIIGSGRHNTGICKVTSS